MSDWNNRPYQPPPQAAPPPGGSDPANRPLPGGYPAQPYWPSPPPPQPGNKGRNTALIAVVATAVAVMVLAVGGVVVVLLTGGQDGGRGGRAARATAKPAPDNPAPGNDAPSGDKVRAVMAAVRPAGYLCTEAATEPVVTYSCYKDPAALLRTEAILIQTDAAGAIIAAEVSLSNDDDPAAVSTLFDKTLKALTPSLLTAGDVEAVTSTKAKGRPTKTAISWGSATLSIDSRGFRYKLTMEADGVRLRAVPHGAIKPTIDDIRHRFTPKGFKCGIDSLLKSLKCTRREADAAYDVFAFDDCLKAGPRYDLICKDRGVFSMQASAGFRSGLPEQAYEPILTFLLDTTEFGLGGWTPETQKWVQEKMNDAKPHQTDLQGVHFELNPGGGASGGFPNVYSVVVSGINLTL